MIFLGGISKGFRLVKLTTTTFPAFCEASGLPRPVAEHRFAWPARKWAFDFAWPTGTGFDEAGGVALEVEGGVYGRGKPCAMCGLKRRGAHSSTAGILRDMAKYNAAALSGWRVLRCLPEDFESGKVLDLLKEIFKEKTHAETVTRKS